MRPDERDAGYLWDMLDAARTVGELIAGSNFHQYSNDRRTQLAVERAIEIIGEAASRVSKPFQEDHPEVPWRQIIAQRNVLAHEYGEINKIAYGKPQQKASHNSAKSLKRLLKYRQKTTGILYLSSI